MRKKIFVLVFVFLGSAGGRADSFDIMGELEKEDSDEEEEPELRKDKDGNYVLTDWDNEMEVSIPKPEGMIDIRGLI